MANEKLCLKDYIHCVDDKTMSKTRKRMNKKSYKGRYYGGVPGDQSGAVTESLLVELLGGALPGAFSANVLSHTQASTKGWPASEEQETTRNKIDQARQMFQSLVNRPNMSRKDIIQYFIDNIGVTQHTAVSYYERLAKEAGLTSKDDKEDLGQSADMRLTPTNGSQNRPVNELPADTHNDLRDEKTHTTSEEQGIIRTVPDAHLVYKRQTGDGDFEELWIYNIGNNIDRELKIRRDILAGTDIPPKSTRSADGSQKYTLTTLGNAQLLHITGLPN